MGRRRTVRVMAVPALFCVWMCEGRARLLCGCLFHGRSTISPPPSYPSIASPSALVTECGVPLPLPLWCEDTAKPAAGKAAPSSGGSGAGSTSPSTPVDPAYEEGADCPEAAGVYVAVLRSPRWQTRAVGVQVLDALDAAELAVTVAELPPLQVAGFRLNPNPKARTSPALSPAPPPALPRPLPLSRPPLPRPLPPSLPLLRHLQLYRPPSSPPLPSPAPDV
jgi:hypothetical protein